MSKISLDLEYEKSLVASTQKDIQHFGELYSHYYPHILKFCNLKLNSKELAEDITAQTFQKAIQNIQSFNWQDVSFSAWLYQIAKRLIIDQYRKQTRQKTFPIGLHSEDLLPPSTEDIQTQTIFSIQSDAIQAKLLNFPPKEKQIIYLKFYLGYSNKLIAQITKLSETNIGTVIHRTVKKLKKSLS